MHTDGRPTMLVSAQSKNTPPGILSIIRKLVSLGSPYRDPEVP
jgi:hypothetical protein